jgi:enoyl-CoA hydratase
MGADVRLEVDDGVGVIRLDRPPANAIDLELALALQGTIREADGRSDVGAIVVWGGPRIFAAGADIKAMVDYGPGQVAEDVGALEQACRDLEAIPKVTIAAIEGFALGGGLEVALACDLRVAGQNAKLGLPEIRLGIIPGSGGTQRLPRLIGLARARQMVFSGDPVSADRALESGLVDAVSPAGETYAHASRWAESHAAGPSLAFAAAKRALAAADRPLEEGLGVEREAFVALFETRDQEEGMRAFLDKREPRFEGR